MKTYMVTIKATIQKTMEVKADSEDEAVSTAHELFTPLNDEPEKYNEEVISCVRQ